MPISLKQCEKKVKPLASLPLPFGVDWDVLEGQLAKALAEHAYSLEHASRVIARLVSTEQSRPFPARLIEACGEVSCETGGPGGIPDACAQCRDQGGYWVRQTAVKDLGFGQREYHYSGRCNCARGKWLAAKDRELQSIEYCHV